ncbi:MAG TPA: PQQ-dependent sugar dehydrogenase [Candidatus Nitrosocosmicus sp.]|nr:PQQ-dependent sugar dehydrogenase [Candidatus Nitrosocosmicus sp.]
MGYFDSSRYFYLPLFFLISILLIYHFNFSHSQTDSDNKYKVYYGCAEYGPLFHCDPIHNIFESYAFTANETQIYSVTRNDSFYVQGQLDSGLEMYDKNREYVEINNTAIYNTDTFSISFWLKGIRDTSPYGHVFSHTNRENTAGWFFELKTSEENKSSSANQFLRFILTNSSEEIIPSKDVYVSNNSFVNVIVTFDGSKIKLYNNGKLFQEIDFKGNYTADPKLPLHIGSASYCSSCNRWSGIIDDIRMYDRAITEQEVKTLYDFTMDSDNIILDGLVGFWKLNGNLDDDSKYHNHGKMFTPLSSMVFTPDGKMLFSEKNTGKIKIMKNNQVLKKPFAIIGDHYVDWEQGVLGLTVDREYEKNHYVYLYYTASLKNGEPINRVVRFTDVNNTARDPVVLIDNIPASRGFHAGGALAMGSDNKLYITVGDATKEELTQSTSVVVGKVLRINRDGSIPQDNPFPNSPVYTLGHRNMFGIAFDDKQNIGIVTENGDAIYDEVNLLRKGGNYGFPTLQPANLSPETSNFTLGIKPLRSYWNTNAPTQAIYYTGDNFPLLKNHFLFGTYTGNIYGIYVNNETRSITDEIHIKLQRYPFEPVIGIAQSPHGNIYSGSYHIKELTSINLDKQRQDLYPLAIVSPKNVVIDKITLSKNKEIYLNLHRNSTGTNFLADQIFSIEVPKSLFKESINVTIASNLSRDVPSQSAANYTISNDNDQDVNEISIYLPEDKQLYYLINSTNLGK